MGPERMFGIHDAVRVRPLVRTVPHPAAHGADGGTAAPARCPQLLNIYRKDCVIRLPFLRLGIVSPEALLSHDGVDAELQDTLSYLCEDESEVRP